MQGTGTRGNGRRMGTKFRLSPMMETYVSQRPEDRNRDNPRKITGNAYQTRSKGPGALRSVEPIKVGPPRKEGVAKRVTFEERAPEKEGIPKGDLTPELSQRKDLPYVEVPPLKMTHRNKDMTDQSLKITPAYRSRAPVEIGIDVEKLVETVLDLEINVPLRSLAGVSNAIQKEIKKQVTRTKLPPEAVALVNVEEESSAPFTRIDNLPSSAYMVTEKTEEFPEGYMVADDPMLQYLAEHKEANPETLIVSGISEPLRGVYGTINGVGQEQCLLDNGSMIVSMARKVAIELGLNWDPALRINMESASNHVEKTLGLARNVRFDLGGLNIFLQVHILENPPYRVLLGRTFDRYASTELLTNPDGTSVLTVVDPNTKQRAAIPTYERGTGPETLQKQKFQSF